MPDLPMRLWNVRLAYDRPIMKYKGYSYTLDRNYGIAARTAEEAMRIAIAKCEASGYLNPFIWSVGHRGVIDIPSEVKQ